MKTIPGLRVLAASVAAMFTQAITAQENIPAQPFSRIVAHGVARIDFRQSDSTSVRLFVDESDRSKVEISFYGNALRVSTKGDFKNNVRVEVSSPRIRMVECNGVTSFRAEKMRMDTFELQVEGASDAKADIESAMLIVAVKGAASAVLSGSANVLNADVHGAGTLKAYDLVSQEADVETHGAATAKVRVEKSLKAYATGASSIRIKGAVQNISAESSTSASIARARDAAAGNVPDSTRVRWKGRELGEHRHPRAPRSHENPWGGHEQNNSGGRWHFYHWAGFYLGVNGFLSPQLTLSQPSKYSYLDLDLSSSINLQLNFFQHNFRIVKNYVILVTGLGIDWRRYAFDNNTRLDPDSSFTHGTIDNSGEFSYQKNVLKYAMLQMPLLLEFNSSKKVRKAFHLAFGVIGQFMMSSKTKQEMTRRGDEITVIHRDNYNMNPFQAKAHVSLGYSHFTLYAEYNMTPLFRSGRGPMIQPFTAGLVLLPATWKW